MRRGTLNNNPPFLIVGWETRGLVTDSLDAETGEVRVGLRQPTATGLGWSQFRANSSRNLLTTATVEGNPHLPHHGGFFEEGNGLNLGVGVGWRSCMQGYMQGCMQGCMKLSTSPVKMCCETAKWLPVLFFFYKYIN